MWQRIQTLYLIIALAGALSAGLLPLWGAPPQRVFDLIDNTQDMLYGIHGYIPIFYIGLFIGSNLMAVAILCIICIFSYRRRKRQLILGRISSLLITSMLAGILYITLQINSPLLEGFYILIATLLASILATRGIRKDIQLVRSADRLRL